MHLQFLLVTVRSLDLFCFFSSYPKFVFDFFWGPIFRIMFPNLFPHCSFEEMFCPPIPTFEYVVVVLLLFFFLQIPFCFFFPRRVSNSAHEGTLVGRAPCGSDWPYAFQQPSPSFGFLFLLRFFMSDPSGLRPS